MKLAVWSNYYYELSPEDAVKEFIKNGIYASELADERELFVLFEYSKAVCCDYSGIAYR